MASTRMMRAAIRTENGHQMIVLPDDIRFDGDEVLVRQDLETGQVTLASRVQSRTARELFAAIDAYGKASDESWIQFRADVDRAKWSKSAGDIELDRSNG